MAHTRPTGSRRQRIVLTASKRPSKTSDSMGARVCAPPVQLGAASKNSTVGHSSESHCSRSAHPRVVAKEKWPSSKCCRQHIAPWQRFANRICDGNLEIEVPRVLASWSIACDGRECEITLYAWPQARRRLGRCHDKQAFNMTISRRAYSWQ